MSNGPNTWHEFKVALVWIATIILSMILFSIINYFFTSVLRLGALGTCLAFIATSIILATLEKKK